MTISSQAALNPMKRHSLYCSAKSARDMYCQCLAVENPHLNILNYAPGVVLTALWRLALTKGMKNEEAVEKHVKEAREFGVYSYPAESATRLMAVLVEGNFKSGEHVDYFGTDKMKYYGKLREILSAEKVFE